jgi:CDP-diacylglycerol--glycerol-3-phosphate 3-phosphatidyltransferase
MTPLSPKSLIVNALTLSRVPLIFVYLVFAILGNFSESYVYPMVAVLAGAAAGISDFFDGMLARRWCVVSDFGKMADPLMDKVYFIVAFPSLVWLAAMQGESPAHTVALLVFTILWILRDQWVTFLRAVASLYHANVAAMWLGKVRTALSFPCAGFIYLYLATHRCWTDGAERLGFYACFAIEGFLILLNIYSFAVYTRSYLPYIQRAIGRDGETREGR